MKKENKSLPKNLETLSKFFSPENFSVPDNWRIDTGVEEKLGYFVPPSSFFTDVNSSVGFRHDNIPEDTPLNYSQGNSILNPVDGYIYFKCACGAVTDICEAKGDTSLVFNRDGDSIVINCSACGASSAIGRS